MIQQRTLDKVGKRFGKLTVIEVVPRSGQRPLFKIKCICGNIFTGSYRLLKHGENRKCSCTIRPKITSWRKGKTDIWHKEAIDRLRKLLLKKKATNWDWVVEEYTKYRKENKYLLQRIAYKNNLSRPYMICGGDRRSEKFLKNNYKIH